MTIKIDEVAENTYAIDYGKDSMFDLIQVAYLVVDDKSAIIDPGSTFAASELLESSGRLGVDLDRLAYIIPTHIHVDHGGGSGYLARELPGAKVVLHPRAAAHMMRPAKLTEGVRAVFGQKFDEALGPILPVPRERMYIADDGQVIRLGGRELTVYYAPGHAPHHIAIWDSLTEGVFCGDALGYISEDMPDMPMPVCLPPFDPYVYVETIDKLAGLSPRIAYYAHHGARSDAAELISLVREMAIAFRDIVQKSLQAGEDDKRITQRVLQYVRTFKSDAELPLMVEASVAGYIDYYRNQM